MKDIFSKILVAVWCLFMFFALFSCRISREDLRLAEESAYESGYDDGFDSGYTEGYDYGYNAGYEDAYCNLTGE